MICPLHGKFSTTFDNHVHGKQGCPSCAKKHIRTNEEFIEDAKKANEGKNYDYSLTDFKRVGDKVKVICKEKDILGNEHGVFEVRASHLLKGHGCPKCAHRYLTTEEWIAMAKRVHGDKYDYSLIDYKNKNKEKGKFICHEKDENGNEHGVFEQSYSSHLGGCGCPKCKGGVKFDQEEFIKKAKEIHGDTYDYSQVKYVNARTPVKLVCKVHGVFEQSPYVHLSRSWMYCMQSWL